MFRPPERLEKWIAFDGALGADILVAEAEVAEAADGNADADAGDGFTFVEAFADVEAADADAPDARAANGNTLTVGDEADETFNGGSGRITVTIPGGASADDYLPYIKDESIFNYSSGVDAEDIYFEISMPGGGRLGFHSVPKDTALDKYSYDEAYEFIDANGQVLNGDILMIDGSDRVMFMYQEGGKYFLQEYQLVDSNDGGDPNDRLAPVENGATVEVSPAGGGHGLRFHVTDSGTLSTERVINSIFRSLTYTPNNDGGSVPAFDVTVYYNTSGQPGQFTDAPGGIYDPENENVVVDSTDSDFTHVTHGDLETSNPGDGGDDEGTGDGDEGGDDYVPPGDDGGGDGEGDGEGEGESEGDDGGDESGDDTGNDAGGEGDADSGSDSGLPGDDAGYIFQSDDDSSSGEDGDGAADDGQGNAAPVVEEQGDGDRSAASAAEVRQLELARDMEFMLTAVRNDKEVLLSLIGRLQNEYLLREPEEFGELRGYLRRLFDMGQREESTVNRIIGAMNREMQVFRGTAQGLRDGMLSESVRELIDSAERHSGEMGAYSKAIEAVAGLLEARREGGLPPPSDAEASALFTAEYEAAMSVWLADAERIDPMGRELTAAQRTAQ